MNLYVTILAAGHGTRMNSNIPKVLHLLHDKPMIVWIIETCLKLNPQKILIVIGPNGALIKDTIKQYIISDIISDKIAYVIQNNPSGTADAVYSTLPYLEAIPQFKNLILNGDVPLLTEDTLRLLIETSAPLVVGTIKHPNPKGYGRIIMKDNKFHCIVEDKDCNDMEREIDLVNCGLYIVDRDILLTYLPKINNHNSQKEYYLTDLIKFSPQKEIVILPSSKLNEIYNVNTPNDLQHIHNISLT